MATRKTPPRSSLKAGKGKVKPAKVRTTAKKSPAPTPRLSRVPLNSIEDVRRAMSRIFRECRSGLLAPEIGTRLIYILGQIRVCIEAGDLEKQVIELREKVGEIASRSTQKP